MQNYKQMVNDLITAIDAHMGTNLTLSDVAHMGDWKLTTAINGISAAKLTKMIDDNLFNKHFNDSIIVVDFATPIEICGNSVIEDLLDACPLKMQIRDVSKFSNVTFPNIHRTRLIFSLQSNQADFDECDCTAGLPGMFYINSRDTIMRFDSSVVSSAFFQKMKANSFSFINCTGLDSLEHLSHVTNLYLEGSNDNHFPLSFSHICPNLQILYLAYRAPNGGNRTMGPKTLTCLKNIHTHIRSIGNVRIDLELDIDIPLLGLSVIECKFIKLNVVNNRLKKCADIMSEMKGGSERLNLDQLLEVQDKMIEIGGGKYATF